MTKTERGFVVQRLIQDLIEGLVDHPEMVKVEATDRPSAERFVWAVWTAPADVGRVLGKGGQTVRALRLILSSLGSRDGLTYELDVKGYARGANDQG